MKNRITYVTLFTFLLFQPLFSQETSSDSDKRASIEDVYISAGRISNYNIEGSLKSFEALTGESYDGNKIYGVPSKTTFGSGRSNVYTLAFGINFKDKGGKEKDRFQLRLGLSYSGSIISSAIWTSSRKVGDSRVIPNSFGEDIIIDTIVTTNYGYEYETKNLVIGVSTIFNTRRLYGFKGYAGAGVSAGGAIDANTYVDGFQSFSERTTTSNSNSTAINESFGTDDKFVKNVKNSYAWAGSAYSVIGFDYQFGSSNPFWNKIHLGYELRAGIRIQTTPELESSTLYNNFLSNSLTMGYSL